jgi:hypothetical protein
MLASNRHVMVSRLKAVLLHPRPSQRHLPPGSIPAPKHRPIARRLICSLDLPKAGKRL